MKEVMRFGACLGGRATVREPLLRCVGSTQGGETMATASAPATQGEGKTVPLGRLGPLKIMSVPVFVGVWAALGPGFVWASLGQGSGELIWWP
jgi:hypothetical protein